MTENTNQVFIDDIYQELTNEFQDGGSRRKTKRRKINKTLRRSRHKVNRDMH